MNEAFEKYWADQLKSCGATCERERILPPYQEVFEAGAAAMREKCTGVAENETRPVGEHMRNFNDEGYNDACEDIAAATRKLEVN